MTVRIQVVLDVTFNGGRVSMAGLRENLKLNLEQAIAHGALTDGLPLKTRVQSYDLRAHVRPAVERKTLVDFMRQRMEDGELAAEDLPGRLVAYGLTDPADFANEINERLEMAREDAKAH